MSATLWASAFFSLLAGIVYAYIGRKVSKRRVAEDAQLASDLFGVWWYGLAGTTFVSAAVTALGAYGVRDVPLVAAATYVNLLAICVALWGLLYYLVYLYTGRRGAIVPLTLFYIAYYMTLAYYLTASDPVGVQVTAWSVGLEYANQIQGPVVTAILLLLVMPQILAALAYFLLFFRVQGRTQRFRIAVVSWSIVIWFSSALVGSFTGASGTLGWNIFTRVLGLAAAFAMLIAYLPPRWMRQRYGLGSVDQEVASSG